MWLATEQTGQFIPPPPKKKNVFSAITKKKIIYNYLECICYA